MKEYVSPLVSEIAITETATPNQSGVTPPQRYEQYSGNEWTADISYCNHNSGSHSEIKFIFHNRGQQSGYNIKCDVVVIPGSGLRISSVTPGDSCLTLSNLNETGFTITRSDRKYNPNESIEFVSQIVFTKADGTVGAAGTSGVTQACDLKVLALNAY